MDSKKVTKGTSANESEKKPKPEAPDTEEPPRKSSAETSDDEAEDKKSQKASEKKTKNDEKNDKDARKPSNETGKQSEYSKTRSQKRSSGNYVDYPDNENNKSRAPSLNFHYSDVEDDQLYRIQKCCHEVLRRYFHRHRDSNTNVILSPLASFFEMTLIAAGAKDETLSGICKAMFFEDNSCIETAALLQKMFNNDKELILENIIGVFSDESIEIGKKFCAVVENVFAGDLETVNFEESTEATKVINNWLSDRTEGSVSNFAEVAEKNVKIALFQVVSLKSFWNTEFPTCKTKVSTFYGPQAKEIPVEFICVQGTYEYVDCFEDGFKVAFFPFETQVYGNEWEFALFLPWTSDFNINKLSHFMKAKQLRRLKKKVVKGDLDVEIPLFSVENDINVGEILAKMGGRISGVGTDFSGMRYNRYNAFIASPFKNNSSKFFGLLTISITLSQYELLVLNFCHARFYFF